MPIWCGGQPRTLFARRGSFEMLYTQIFDAAVDVLRSGDDTCMVVSYRRFRPSWSYRPRNQWEWIHLGRGGPKTELQEVRELPGWQGQLLFTTVPAQVLLAWSTKPRTPNGDVPRVMKVVGFKRFVAEGASL